MGFIIIISIIVFIVLRRKKLLKAHEQIELEKTGSKDNINDDSNFNPQNLKTVIIKYDALTFGKILGEGSFGIVQR